MRHRYFLVLLLAFTLVYYALPRLSFTAQGGLGYFSLAWALLALIVIGGNLAAIMYTPKREKQVKQQNKPSRKRLRMY